jgi:hypothetical protein
MIKKGGFMRKSDDDLKIDINEIFGDDWVIPIPKKAEVIVPAPEPEPPPEISAESNIELNDSPGAPVAETMVLAADSDPSPSEAVAVSEKIEMSEVQTSVPIEAAVEEPVEVETSSKLITAETSGERSDPEDFFFAYDQFREIFMEELKESVGPRKTCMMLTKTFELAREKYPEVFRNANWDPEGNLVEDGSLNALRMLANKNALDESQADIIVDTALISLLNLRLQAVKKGLGQDFYQKTRMSLKKWVNEKSQKNGAGKEDPKILRRLSHYLL